MHVVVMMVVVVVMVVVVMMMMHVVLFHRSGGRSGRGGFLRDGVAGQADGQRGGDDKALDHGQKSSRRRPQRPSPQKLT
jgi:preprotein translocase subunit SecG